VKDKKVGVIVGSLRQDAYSRWLARAMLEIAPSSMILTEIAIGALPHYNQDLETTSPPEAWTQFRKQVIESDAILFLTPEYNRSMPGAVKNALDVGSRPWGQSAWSGKPAAVISISPGALGAMAANHHLRQVLYAVNLAAMAYPEAYLHSAGALFDLEGKLTNPDTKSLLQQFCQAFDAWIEKIKVAR
jgi:chromate reductase, NAD(P)H dehydrogenase (quinone)